MKGDLIKLAVGIVVVALIANLVAMRVVRQGFAANKQRQAGKLFASPVAVAPMADEAFVNYRG